VSVVFPVQRAMKLNGGAMGACAFGPERKRGQDKTVPSR
jgi:hypothetical protein